MKKNQLKDSFFDNINSYKLDYYQRKIILNNHNNLLVIAGAGSGKTLTIVGKVKYLIEKKGLKKRDILCLSFTNETVNSLKKKLDYDIDVFTFHRLALNIIKKRYGKYHISSDRNLEYIINEYLKTIRYNSELNSLILEYFSIVDDYESFLIKYPNYMEELKYLIINFIKRIKTNDYNIDIFKKKWNNQEKCFLIIALKAYYIYLEELNSAHLLDFDDMIKEAIDIIKSKKVRLPYKYIIIDEYQDTSYMKYLLIKSICDINKSLIMCVGDDYQSIYGFSGCNVDFFINFNKYFKNTKKMYIKYNYRNDYHIIKTSNSFIRKNKYQLKKKVYANYILDKPIKFIYYDNQKDSFRKLLNYLEKVNKKKILILGRYNNNIYEVIPEYNSDYQYKDFKLRYLTIHKAKGLEEDDVIILSMVNNYFPSVRSDKLDCFFPKKKEKYLYAEERRLFYVALTRTKGNVYIMVPNSNCSQFVCEIKSKGVELKLK